MYNIVQSLQNYDVAFSHISEGVSHLFGMQSDTNVANFKELEKIEYNLGICKQLVQKLHICIQQLKGLAKLLDKTGHAPYEAYFKTMSLLDSIVIAKKIVDAYSVQTCVNDGLIKELIQNRGNKTTSQLLLAFSLQPVTHAVKHQRAMLYVDCIK